jgi:predicted RNase H-like nuclease (RuvC/YqgF family)
MFGLFKDLFLGDDPPRPPEGKVSVSRSKVKEANENLVYLIKACQHKNAEIRQLEAKVKEQEREIEFLKGMLAQLAKK